MKEGKWREIYWFVRLELDTLNPPVTLYICSNDESLLWPKVAMTPLSFQNYIKGP
jgi:hypothetical protein